MIEAFANEYNSTSSGPTVITNLNLGSVNMPNLNPVLYPIQAGTNSYEKWIKLQFNGTITTISDFKVYKNSGDYVTGETLYYNGQKQTFTTPTNSKSIVAITPMPTSEPATPNVSVGGDLDATITESGSTTDYIVIQSCYSNNTSAGPVNEKEIVFSWTES